jgi:type VI secretion system secreted protein VgrG
MVATQHLRSVEVTSPLGADRLLLRRMTAVDGLSRPFEIDLHLLSTDPAIALSDVLGQPMTVRLDLPENHRRFFNGIVSRFCYQGSFGDFASYEARVRPWLWFLSRTADCRIFQSKTVPDIVKELFHKHGFSDFRDLTTQTYRTREYCVQYRETDFDFVSRLMEEEGIYY